MIRAVVKSCLSSTLYGRQMSTTTVTAFSCKSYDITSLGDAQKNHAAGLAGVQFDHLESRLSLKTLKLAEGSKCIAAFVNDDLSAPVLKALHADCGVRMIALRSAGYNNVHVPTAKELGMTVTRVPAYSPNSVAEHAVGMILCENRKLHRAFNRVRENNFTLSGLLGFDICKRTVGVVGTGCIGAVFARIMAGFGCRVLAYDPHPSPELLQSGAVSYVDLESLIRQSDIISLHCPQTPENTHMIDGTAIEAMKPGVMIVNTSRGGLVDTEAMIHGLKRGKIGSVCIDVYEKEGGVFHEDYSSGVLEDDTLARLMTFNNVLITSHQAFFTQEALSDIAEETVSNIVSFLHGKKIPDGSIVTAP